MANDPKLKATSAAYEKTASVRLEADGEIVFRDFAGREWEIDVKRTQLVQALGSLEKTLDYIAEMLGRSMQDVLILSNLCPSCRKAPELRAAEKAATKVQVDGTAPPSGPVASSRAREERA